MKVEIAEIELHIRSVQDEGSTSGITEVRSGPNRIRDGHWNRGPRRNWVTPWLTTSKASTCLNHCDGFECDGYDLNIV
jgi:hypothetical protein